MTTARKPLAILLAILLAMTLAPMAVHAAPVTGPLDFVNTITGDANGDGWDWDSGEKILTLNGFELDNSNGVSVAILLPAGSTIVLEGINSISTNAHTVIKVEGSLTVEGDGSLDFDAPGNGFIGGYGIDASSIAINGAALSGWALSNFLQAHGDIVIDGAALDITSGGWAMRSAGGSATITGSTVTIGSGEECGEGIYAPTGVTIENSTVDITTGEWSRGIESPLDSITVTGSDVTIDASADYADGVGARGDFTITGGSLDIASSGYGIAVQGDVTLTNCLVSVVGEYDGIWAGGGITITGGSGTIQTLAEPEDDCWAVAGEGSPIALGGGVTVKGWDGGAYTVPAMVGIGSYDEYSYSTFVDANDPDVPLLNVSFSSAPAGWPPLDFVNVITSDDSDVGWDWNNDEKILALDGLDLSYSGEESFSILLPGGSTIVLAGENSVVYERDDWWGNAIWCLGDLAIEGTGSLQISAHGYDGSTGIYTFDDGAEVDGSLTISGCTVTIDADGCGINTNDLTIGDGADVTVTASSGDAIDAMGDILFDGAVVDCSAGWLGIVAYGNFDITDSTVTSDNELRGDCLTIGGSTVVITNDDEHGILAGSVTINSGTVTITAKENGIEADGGDITISGGTVEIHAGWIGMQASNDVVVSGGEITVDAAMLFGIYGENSVTFSGGSGTVKTYSDAAPGCPAVMSYGAPVVVGGVIVKGWDGDDYTVAASAAYFYFEDWEIDYHSFADADDPDGPLMNLRFGPAAHSLESVAGVTLVPADFSYDAANKMFTAGISVPYGTASVGVGGVVMAGGADYMALDYCLPNDFMSNPSYDHAAILANVTAMFGTGDAAELIEMLVAYFSLNIADTIALTAGGATVIYIIAPGNTYYKITINRAAAQSQSHTHSYGAGWVSDASNHWHECACGQKSGTAAHTPGGWIVDLAATATTDGSRHRACTVCGYVTAAETIPATGEDHTHTPGDWIIDLAPTATTDGSKHKACAACGYITETATIPAIGGAIAVPAIVGDKNVKLDYLGSKQLSVTGEGVTWSSGNEKYVKVDPGTGKITSQKAFWKTGGAIIKAENSAGSVEFNVKVRPTLRQWLMIIFLFGWIWY